MLASYVWTALEYLNFCGPGFLRRESTGFAAFSKKDLGHGLGFRVMRLCNQT